MRILVVHDYYQRRGGEDSVFEAEASLLQRKGNDVTRFTVHNRQIAEMKPIRAGLVTIWNRTAYTQLRQLVQRVRPDIAHFHNTFPLLSPAVHYAARREGVAVVQTLHNFRFLCSNGLLLRNGHVCEDCLGKPVAWPALVHRCYRGSRLASSAVVAMQGVHRALGSWLKNIDRFIAPSDFLRRKVVANGLPGDAIVVKPHFVAHDPGPGDGLGGFVLFVGRLSGEKGVETLLRAWHHDRRLPPLRIVGDGPMANEVRQAAAALPHVHALGALTLSQVLDLLGAARFLIVPSICYESFASVVAESFAKGTPVIASGHGALAESVTDGYTGFHFPPGNHTELASTVVRGMGSAPHEYELQRAAARAAFERHYTAEHNYDMLCEIYRQAFAVAGAR